MKFEKFWVILQRKLKKQRKLKTYRRGKEFDALFTENNTIKIEPKEATDGPYYLNYNKMKKIWNIAKKTKGEPRYWTKTYKSNKINTSSYAIAFLIKFLKNNKIE